MKVMKRRKVEEMHIYRKLTAISKGSSRITLLTQPNPNSNWSVVSGNTRKKVGRFFIMTKEYKKLIPLLKRHCNSFSADHRPSLHLQEV